MRRLFRQFSLPGRHPAATWRRRRPARSTRAASWATRSSHAYGAAFDNPDLIVACVVGDGEAETGPLATSWHSNKFLDPVARRRRAADPAPQRLQDRQPDRAGAHPRRRADGAAGGLRLRAASSSRATTRRTCTRRWRPRWTRPSTRSRRIQRAAREDGVTDATALADDRAAHAQGLDRARRTSTASRSRARGAPTRCRWPRCAPTPTHRRHPRGRGCAATGPRSSSTRTARLAAGARGAGARGRAADERQPARQRRPAAARPRLPDFRDYAVRRAERRVPRPREATRVLGTFLRDVMAGNADDFRLFGPGRDRVQPAGCRVRGHRPGLDGRDRCRATSTWRRTAG